MTHLSHTSRSFGPAELRELGKSAADLSIAHGLGMDEAVVRTIGSIKLSSEQVRRVVEAANHAAFNSAYSKTSGRVRAVHFEHGPADPQAVIDRLRAESSVTKAAADMSYAFPPSVRGSSAGGFLGLPETVGAVMKDVRALQEKLAFAHEEAVAGAEVASMDVSEALETLSRTTKIALEGGARPDDLYAAWAEVHPELAKTAADRLRLRLTGVKTAGVRINPDHVVVTSFENMCRAVESYGAYDAARRTIELEQVKLSEWIRKAVA